MLHIHAFGFLSLLAYFMGASTAPTNATDGNITLGDIINIPIVAAPLNPAFQPILAVSNKTVVDTNPNVQSKINNLPSVISSITAAAAGAPAATVTKEAKARDIIITIPNPFPTAPPSPIYGNTDCALANSPSTSQFLWNAAALRACHEWFGVPGDTYPYNGPGSSPAAYLVEGAASLIAAVGGNFGFQFEYSVRDDPNPFQQYYLTSQNLCYAEVQARIAWMFNNCLAGDVSGFSSYNDGNSVIRYKAWRYPGPPTGFSPDPRNP